MENSPTRSIIDVGSVIDETYTIEALIGRGGMGAVFLASHKRLAGKKVAIKMLLADLGGDEILARFKREADIASTLDHPNIVKVENYNVLPDGTPYIAYEFLQGESLAQRLAAGPMALDPIYSLLRGVGSALAAAHRAGIVHRDLKPQNIFLVQSEVAGNAVELAKVLDFGISKLRGSTTVKTQEATLLGTPQYMAPEQATGQHSNVDDRTDIFALGAIVYEMVSGRPAFSGASIPEVVFKVVYEQPAPLDASVPPHIARAIEKAMAKPREERFASVSELVEAITGQPLAPTTRPPLPGPATTGERKKNTANEAFAQTMGSGDHGPAIAVAPTTASKQSPSVRVPSSDVNAVAATVASAPGTAAAPSIAPQAKRSLGWILGLVIGGAALAAGGVYFAMRGSPPAPQQPPSRPTTDQPVAAPTPAPTPAPAIDAGVQVASTSATVARDAGVAEAPLPRVKPPAVKPPPPTPTPETEAPGDPEIDQRLTDAEAALRAKAASRASQLANVVITSQSATRGQRAHAHVIHGIMQCTDAHSEEGAQIDLRQLAGFPGMRHRLIAACHAEGVLQTEAD